MTALLGSRYALGEVIAHGGASIVRRGFDLRLGRTVAVKTRRPGAAVEDGADDARLRAEARTLAAVRAPGVVACLDAGEDERGAPYLVMDHLAGPNLTQVSPDASRESRLAWAVAATRALAGLHDAGWLHGDVKPSHCVLRDDGRVTLVDLAAAVRLGAPGRRARAGTPAYLAPEVAAGSPPSVASDLYALGVTLARLFAPDAPACVAGLTTDLTAPSPGRRPPAARAVLDALLAARPRPAGARAA